MPGMNGTAAIIFNLVFAGLAEAEPTPHGQGAVVENPTERDGIRCGRSSRPPMGPRSGLRSPFKRIPTPTHALWRFFDAGKHQVGVVDAWKSAPEQRGISTARKGGQAGCIVTLGNASWSCVANTLPSNLRHRRRAAVTISRRG